MEARTRKVVFANEELEEDYKRLAAAMHSEDKKRFLVLQDIRKQLLMKCRSGKEIPEDKIPEVYRRLFRVRNLWSLDLPPHGRVLYSLVEEEIRIVDIL